jgi:hypothetical protein
VEETLTCGGLTSTIALAVVLLGLVGYIYFVDSKRPASGAADTKAKAFTVEADQIEEIQIKPAAAESSRAEKTNGTWLLVEPEKTDADQGQLTNTATSLASLEVNGVVDDNPSDLAQYGLNPAKLDVAFRVKGDKDPRHLLIGEKTAAGGDLYAKRADEKRVILISSYLEGTFNRTPFDLRDKTLLKFDHDKVDGLEIVRGGVTTQLAKSNGEWTIVKPYTARADFGTAEAALSSLSSTQMQKIVAANAVDLKAYGLDPPEVTTTVISGSARATLAIGKVEGDAAYARDVSRPMVFTIPQAAAVDLEKGADMFRRKDMFDGRSFNASRVELHRGAETLTFDAIEGQGRQGHLEECGWHGGRHREGRGHADEAVEHPRTALPGSCRPGAEDADARGNRDDGQRKDRDRHVRASGRRCDRQSRRRGWQRHR